MSWGPMLCLEATLSIEIELREVSATTGHGPQTLGTLARACGTSTEVSGNSETSPSFSGPSKLSRAIQSVEP